MSNQIQQYIDRCKCGCDKTSHYKDSQGYGNCTNHKCDCAEFKDPKEPGPYKKQRNWSEHGPSTPRYPW